jgi:hypothetical protein
MCDEKACTCGGRRCPGQTGEARNAKARGNRAAEKTGGRIRTGEVRAAQKSAITSIIGGQTIAEIPLKPVEGRSRMLISLDKLHETIGDKPGARLRLLEVQNPGPEDSGLVELVGRGSVILDRVVGDDGRLRELILDNGRRIDVSKPDLTDGLLTLPIDGDPEARTVWKVEAPDDAPLLAMNTDGVDEKLLPRVLAERETLAAVARLAANEAKSRGVDDAARLKEIADDHLSALFREASQLAHVQAAARGIDESEWRKRERDDDPVIHGLKAEAVRAWAMRAKRVDEGLRRQKAKLNERGQSSARLDGWLDEVRDLRKGLSVRLEELGERA